MSSTSAAPARERRPEFELTGHSVARFARLVASHALVERQVVPIHLCQRWIIVDRVRVVEGLRVNAADRRDIAPMRAFQIMTGLPLAVVLLLICFSVGRSLVRERAA